MDPIEFARAVLQHGHVVTPALARSLGVSTSALHRALDHDDVERPFRGVAVVPGSASPSLTRARAAMAALTCSAAFTGWSAAHLYGLVNAGPSEVHLLLPHGCSVARRDGLRLTETSVFPERLVERHGLLLAPAGRMVTDLAPDTKEEALRNISIDARFSGDLGYHDLDQELALRGRFPGRGRVRAIADDLRDDGSDSGFEYRTRDRLTVLGLPPDAGQLHVPLAPRPRRVDMGWRNRKVGLECVGLAYHSGRDALERDAERRNEFAEDGSWTIFELTWAMFHCRWDAFVERLRRVLESR